MFNRRNVWLEMMLMNKDVQVETFSMKEVCPNAQGV